MMREVAMRRLDLLVLATVILVGCGDGSDGRLDGIAKGIGGAGAPPPLSTPTRNVKVELKEEINRRFDSAGKLQFLGELINNGEDPACFVKITIDSKNASGESIASDFSYVNGSTLSIRSTESDSCLNPGEVGGFQINTSQESTPASTSIEIGWDADEVSTPRVPSSQVALDGSIDETTDFFGDKTLKGAIKNHSVHTVNSVKISFIVLHNGLVAATHSTFVKGSTCDATETCLLPEGSGLFEANLNLPPSDVDSYYYKINYSILN